MTLDIDHVPAVGPTSPAGSHAPASLSINLSPGLVLEPVATIPSPDTVDNTILADHDQVRIKTDEVALEGAERTIAMIVGRFSASPKETRELIPEVRPECAIHSPLLGSDENERIEHDNIDNIYLEGCLIPMAASIVGYRVRLRRRASAQERGLSETRRNGPWLRTSRRPGSFDDFLPLSS